MWNHHPGFGGDLLTRDVQIDVHGSDLSVDPDYDEPGNALLPGSRSVWPFVSTVDAGEADLRRPLWGKSALLYVTSLRTGEASIRRLDETLGVRLEWSTKDFPVCWLWEELGGFRGAPWFGRGRVIGVEPSIAYPARGLKYALDTGQSLVELLPGEHRAAEVKLSIDVSAGALHV